MNESEVFQQTVENVARKARACDPPELSTGDLEAIVREAQICSTWMPATAYAFGDVVSPDPPNGFVYTCVVSGTSGDATPFANISLPDGTAGWLATGAFNGFFDEQRAVFNAWVEKKGRAAVLVQQSSAGQSQASQQLFEHCSQMAHDWQPFHAA